MQYDHVIDGELSRAKFNIFARKITKIVFNMVRYEEKTHILEIVINKIFIEIAKRSPKVLYGDRKENNYNGIKEIPYLDISFFPKLIKDLTRSPRKLTNKLLV